MRDIKKFRKSLFGFNAGDVNAYIEKVTKDYNYNLTAKESKIINLRDTLAAKEEECQKLEIDSKTVLEQKEKISSALIMAQEKAELIISEAIEKVENERKDLEMKVEEEKEKLVDIKREVMLFKEGAMKAIQKYDDNIDKIIKIVPPEE